MEDYVGLNRTMQDYVGLCRTFQEYAGIWTAWPDYAMLCTFPYAGLYLCRSIQDCLVTLNYLKVKWQSLSPLIPRPVLQLNSVWFLPLQPSLPAYPCWLYKSCNLYLKPACRPPSPLCLAPSPPQVHGRLFKCHHCIKETQAVNTSRWVVLGNYAFLRFVGSEPGAWS